MLKTILPGTMSDGMYTDNAPKMLSKKLGMQVTQKYPSNLRLITTEYWIADLSSEKEKNNLRNFTFLLRFGNCLANFRQLQGSCKAVVKQLSGSCPAVVRQLSGSYPAFVRQLSSSCQAVVQQLYSSCPVVVQQLSSSCPAGIKQLSGSYQAKETLVSILTSVFSIFIISNIRFNVKSISRLKVHYP